MELDLKWDDNGAIKRLEQLPLQLKKKGLRKAVRKAANVWRDAARRLAQPLDNPDTPLSIPKHIIASENTKLGRREGGIAFRVGVAGGARSQKGEPVTPWYWRFMEFGSETQRAQPFMRPAMENNLELAQQVLIASLNPAIDAALARTKV